MNLSGWLQLGLYLLVLLVLAKPLGAYMAAVYEGRASVAQRIGAPLEHLIYRGAGIDPADDMHWTRYALAMLWFNLVGGLVVYAIQRLQQWLPLNPQSMAAVSPDSSFNTATSFITNTNWQGYGGESTMSYLTQMFALAVQNFVSAATGMAVLVALARGFLRKEAKAIGNFWVDLVRTTVYILLPLSILFAMLLVWQGIPQTFDNYATATLTQPVTYDNPKTGPDGQALKDEKGSPVTEKATTAEQTIALGPVASQIAIKQLGTNGGGYYNVNSAHPLENPTPLTDFLEMLAILLIPAALCYTFGRMIGSTREGWALLAAMTITFAALLPLTYSIEQNGNPILTKLGADQVQSSINPGGNMEGKEVRLGVANSALWATATTAASNGSVNSMHDSFMPLAGMIPLWLIQLGEVIFGGVGSGLYGMIMFAVVAVFVAGLMIGRTPEYLGKKIGAFEIKMASIAILLPPLLVLCGTAVAVMLDVGKAGASNPSEHGFSEILYAWTLPTHTPLFVFVLIGTIITVGALTFVPALALGPVVEHLLLYSAH